MQHPPGGSETVMVIEDEASVLRVACEVLRDQGYTVLEAQNGFQALWMAEEHAESADRSPTDRRGNAAYGGSGAGDTDVRAVP